MTQQKFDKTKFRWGMRAEYEGKVCLIRTVDFKERLFELIAIGEGEGSEDQESFWVRCENIELV